MTDRPQPDANGAGERAGQLVHDAARAARRMAARAQAQVADFASDEPARLNDRLRALLAHLLLGMGAGIETELRQGAIGLLQVQGEREAADRLRGGPLAAELRADPAIVAELLARLRHDLIAERLPVRAGENDEPSLLVRLTDVADVEVAGAARALLVAESRRRGVLAMGDVDGSELPAELHQKLVWQIAAAIRGQGGPALDRALADAARRLLAAHDEGARAEARAMRLALAIDARPQELPALLDEAIGDGRLSLVVAVLAHGAGMSFEQVRLLMVEPDDERWWLLLRAIDLDPLTIARLALALAEADPRRAADGLPDLLDAVNAVPASAARAAIADLRLPDDFRVAVEAILAKVDA